MPVGQGHCEDDEIWHRQTEGTEVTEGQGAGLAFIKQVLLSNVPSTLRRVAPLPQAGRSDRLTYFSHKH